MNFALDGVTVGDFSTDQLPNDMPYPLHSSWGQFKPQPKAMRKASCEGFGVGGYCGHAYGRASLSQERKTNHRFGSFVVQRYCVIYCLSAKNKKSNKQIISCIYDTGNDTSLKKRSKILHILFGWTFSTAY